MNKEWLNHWENRYKEQEYAYGTNPNEFLKMQIESIPEGKILFPAEGEGRNAVYAASLGWHVVAFDISKEGQKKALHLANLKEQTIDYRVGDIFDLDFEDNEFDAIALVYAHFPSVLKRKIHKKLDSLLCSGGTLIFEAFSKNHLPLRQNNPKVGGPRDFESLFSIEEIKSDFSNYNFTYLEELEVELNEGKYHIGKGSVIRFVANKN